MTKAAIIQARPAYYDLAGCVEKATTLIREAAAEGADIITLGETWFPGYPVWLDVCRDVGLWDHGPVKDVFARLHANSPQVPGPEVKHFERLAHELGVVLVLSINERERGTLYNTLLTIGPRGLLNHHRKLVPTYTERMVWGRGDARGLRSVDTRAGRVSALVCWEHWMPLARQALHESGEDIHVAVWPTVKEILQVASRSYAFEGRCYVLAAGSILYKEDLPADLDVPEDIPHLVMRGGSGIIGPDGEYLAGPVYDEETILYADLDLSRIAAESMALDVTGHYSRPDVFRFGVRRAPDE